MSASGDFHVNVQQRDWAWHETVETDQEHTDINNPDPVESQQDKFDSVYKAANNMGGEASGLLEQESAESWASVIA